MTRDDDNKSYEVNMCGFFVNVATVNYLFNCEPTTIRLFVSSVEKDSKVKRLSSRITRCKEVTQSSLWYMSVSDTLKWRSEQITTVSSSFMNLNPSVIFKRKRKKYQMTRFFERAKHSMLKCHLKLIFSHVLLMNRKFSRFLVAVVMILSVIKMSKFSLKNCWSMSCKKQSHRL